MLGAAVSAATISPDCVSAELSLTLQAAYDLGLVEKASASSIERESLLVN